MFRLRWWFMFWMGVAAVSGLAFFGYAESMWKADPTHLGAGILALYFVFSVCIGRLTALADYAPRNVLEDTLKGCDLMVKSMVILGIIGTTWGLLLMLNSAFGGEMNPAVVLAAMKHGLSTLGITTLVGLVCYLLLEVQVLNLEYAIESR